MSIVDEYQDEFTPVEYTPGKGTNIQYDKKMVIFNSATGETSVEQSVMQTLWSIGSSASKVGTGGSKAPKPDAPRFR